MNSFLSVLIFPTLYGVWFCKKLKLLSCENTKIFELHQIWDKNDFVSKCFDKIVSSINLKMLKVPTKLKEIEKSLVSARNQKQFEKYLLNENSIVIS